jgi:alkyl sulfatase BDS1-like metallo-beta-lactamase superfamily hydrolase
MSIPSTEPSLSGTTSFDKASYGLIASLSPCIIKDKTGLIVWNNDEYDFLQKDCPPTVNPKLWRQGQLTSKQGLFKVTTGIYQVRGFDISNMTFVEGKTGVVVLDCLQSVETAASALSFYRQHRGEREIMAVVVSHPHFDHYGGAAGVVTSENIPLIAPAGFMDEVLTEGMVAGPAMRRRAGFMFGDSLAKGPRGHVYVNAVEGTAAAY